MGLFSPAWMSKNEKKALAAVANAGTDELLRITFYAAQTAVRIAAMDRMTDDQLRCLALGLEYTAKQLHVNAKRMPIYDDDIIFKKEETIGRIKSARIIDELARQHEKKAYREYAAHRLLEYPEYWETVALYGTDGDAAVLAKKADDQRLLSVIAGSCAQEAALIAISKLTDEALLNKLAARKDIPLTIKLFACGKLSDWSEFTKTNGYRLTGGISPQRLLAMLDAAGVKCPVQRREAFLDEKRTKRLDDLMAEVLNTSYSEGERATRLEKMKSVVIPSDCGYCVRSLYPVLFTDFGMQKAVPFLEDTFGAAKAYDGITPLLTIKNIEWLGSHLCVESDISIPQNITARQASYILHMAYKSKRLASDIKRLVGKPTDHQDRMDISCNGVTSEHFDHVLHRFKL